MACNPGRTITIDVKGVAGRHDWTCDNIKLPAEKKYLRIDEKKAQACVGQ